MGTLASRRYAVIIDEAHSSQTGEGARHMKEVLAAKSLEDAEKEEQDDEDETSEDRLLKVMASRGKQKNLSFFAFTATPKAKTLEVFGHRDAEGKPIPFHLYSMRQAIEEGFILGLPAPGPTQVTVAAGPGCAAIVPPPLPLPPPPPPPGGDAGVPDAGTDAGVPDAGTGSGSDAGTGSGSDAGTGSGSDAGTGSGSGSGSGYP